ncbi:MAG: sulfotransferase family 2 domain-containing protein [Rhodobacteraceae bacterium]|nr:sulfotransferase family 2 domain-containing protein [Paracoccaceae bacterium]
MIVSPGRGYVFVHIPKTGGTSLALALERRAHRDDILIGDTPKARARRRRLAGLRAAGRLWKHSTLADIDGLLPAATLNACTVFTLVRNPWDRMASYYHWLRAQRFDHPAVRLAHVTDFAGFVAHPDTAASVGAWPARRYTTDAAGHDRCALVLRLEHLDADLRRLEERLGLRLGPLPHVNASDRPRDRRALYDAATAARVAAICAEDIARFGYAF